MPSIDYLGQDGIERVVVVTTGTTVRDAAIEHDVPGILGECGGNAECGTCHVYVDRSQLAALAPIQDIEDAMLDFTACPRADNSRLGCQIRADDAIGCLRVRVPDRQV